MGEPVFQFSAQPALDRAIDEQRAAEARLASARADLEAQKRALSQIEEQISELTQRMAATRENLSAGLPTETHAGSVAAESRRISGLAAMRAQRQADADAQRERVSWSQDRVTLRRKELEEAMSRTQALEKLKEKRREEFLEGQRKRQEREADDSASQRWNAARRAGQEPGDPAT